MKHDSYLHNLGAAHVVGYTGHTKFRIFKWPTPPTTWLAKANSEATAQAQKSRKINQAS